MLLRVLVLMAMVCATRASVCCMAPKFDAIEFFQEGFNAEGKGHLVEGSALVSLDSDLKMTNAYVTINTDGGPAKKMRIIDDYGKMMQFIVTNDAEHGETCEKSPLPTNWTGACIPDGSVKAPPMYFGMGASQYNVDSYVVPLKEQPDWTVYVTVSRADCTIMTESIKGSTQGVGFMINLGMFNATAGIRDPSVFKIPASCSTAKQVDAPYRMRSSILP